jgi:hypothetical protein
MRGIDEKCLERESFPRIIKKKLFIHKKSLKLNEKLFVASFTMTTRHKRKEKETFCEVARRKVKNNFLHYCFSGLLKNYTPMYFYTQRKHHEIVDFITIQ